MITSVPRPTWKPETDEHRRALAELREAVDARQRADEQVWAKFRAAQAVGVPLTYAAEDVGIPRSTLYRHIPPKPVKKAPAKRAKRPGRSAK